MTDNTAITKPQATAIDHLGKIIGAFLVVAGMLFVAPLIGVLTGAFSGWVVGLFFEKAILGTIFSAKAGVTMWELGATLGFIGSFFRPAMTKNKD